MKRYVYMVYSKMFEGQDLVNNTFVFATEADAFAKLVKLNSKVGLPPFIINKVKIRCQ
jgi:hypothetical protein